MAISNYIVTVTSGTAIAANTSRSTLVITNTGGNPVFININDVAEINKGIYLSSNGGVWMMDRGLFTKGYITAITSSGTSNLAIYEL